MPFGALLTSIYVLQKVHLVTSILFVHAVHLAVKVILELSRSFIQHNLYFYARHSILFKNLDQI